MTKYCFFSCVLTCIALLVLGVSCDHVGQAFKTDIGDESVAPETHTGSAIGAGGPTDSDMRAGGTETQRDADETAGHVVYKPVSTGVPAGQRESRSLRRRWRFRRWI